MTSTRKIESGYKLAGLCYSHDCLYVGEERDVESGRHNYSLAVYQVHRDSGDITLLDRLELGEGDQVLWYIHPRADRHSRRVFVPCRDIGVTVARLDGDRLVREMTLTSVKHPESVDVMSPDTVYVGDWHSDSVHAVDVKNDKITLTLTKPDTVKRLPWRLKVLGDSVIVCYGYDTLVVYHHGSPAPVRVIPCPGGLQFVSAVNCHSQDHLMLTDWKVKSVFVIGLSGDLRHTVNINPDSHPVDCVVVTRQLWVGCLNGDIIIMSSQ